MAIQRTRTGAFLALLAAPPAPGDKAAFIEYQIASFRARAVRGLPRTGTGSANR
jgi:hypothetical protein